MIKKIIFLSLLTVHFFTDASEINIKTLDNKPLANAVVWLKSADTEPPSESEITYAMRQVDREFTPRILVVPQNAKVVFPNEDSIMHHVYSFSKAKSFELKLYKEQPKAPIVFDQTGVVELGCNIHDWMLGYIVVVDSALFAITDAEGNVELPATAGTYEMSVWHSGFSDISKVETSEVTLSGIDFEYVVKQPITATIDFTTDEFDDY
ncbi:methylamine utilization protein [Pseudoalteromonas sp. MMG010]|uniref:methylamine utilization protein n=1 Tax=Pseudoalteromonas sp. MMG010 TaxID=2822685 RepID=UPI001B3A0B2C|nr:methylamine utilization protein [Pseudoalteromonas sp. MMG010]MBQ4834344.1 methylamine utilization protein [Pseudoalteromonas sp. MMG010]